MKTLKLVLKKQWYDMIASGEKTEEYRRVCQYWFARLMKYNEAKNYNEFKKFDTVTFYLGYSKNRPSMTFKIKGFDHRCGRPEWGAEKNKRYFVIKLGERL